MIRRKACTCSPHVHFFQVFDQWLVEPLDVEPEDTESVHKEHEDGKPPDVEG